MAFGFFASIRMTVYVQGGGFIKVKNKGVLALTVGLGLLAALLVNASEAARACREGLLMCARLLIPSLFPFFVLSGFLNRLGLPGLLGSLLAPFASRLFGVSGAGASALLIGLTGGYPAGAAYIADMARSGSVSRQEAERLLAFCNNSGPAFIVGAVGIGVFGSVKIGLILYGVHVLAALLTGLLFRGKYPCTETQPILLDSADPALALTESVRQAVSAILSVCGFALCFTVLLTVLDAGGALTALCGAIASRFSFEPQFVRALVTGLFELGSGAAALSGLRACPETLSLSSFLLGWGGLSVHFQTLGVLSGSDVKGALHLTGRLLSAVFAAVLAYVIVW